MSPTLTTFLIVAFFCLMFGAVAGYLIASLRDENGDAPGDEASAPPGGRKGKYSAVARLWLEKSSKTLIVEIDGKAYVSPEPLKPDQLERLEHAVRDLARWLGVSVPREAALSGSRTALLQPAEQKPLPPDDASPAESDQAAPSTETRKAPAEQQPIAADAAPTFKIRPPLPSSPVVTGPARTMVAQIDEIVQEMAAGTRLESYAITLSEDLRRGVIVWVGPTSYEGIDSVPDPEIQRLIRAAAAEWDRRQEQPRPKAP